MKNLNKKGITLIALIITIIVLLILAGVSIATLAGNNGVLTKATHAREETRYGNVNEEVQLWKIDWETYNLVGNVNKPLEEEEFIEKLLTNKLVNENEIDRDKKIITISNKEISYKLDVQANEEVVISELPTSIVASDTTSSKLKVQVQKPESLGEDVEYTYTIKKKDTSETENIIQTHTVNETSFTFTSLEEKTDYLIEVSTSNVNGTIYKGSCNANTYAELKINLPKMSIYRRTNSISCAKSLIYCEGGPRFKSRSLCKMWF